MSILIVDDSYFNRKLVETFLNKAGYVDLIHAESADEAYSQLKKNSTINLILLDIMMPGIDGITACAHIKQEPSFKDIPIIMVTAKNESQSLQAAFDAGAMDYITKPVNPTILKARVNSALTLKKEMDRRKAREQDLIEIGAKIQQTLLLGKHPDHFPGIEIAALTQPSQKIDGDFYDFFCHQEECLDVFLGDVMGKGVPAALVGAATKANFYRAITQLISKYKNEYLPPIEEIVQYVHHVMTNELIDLETFVTLCYIRYHASDQSVDLVDCGHTQTIHYHAKTHSCSLLKGDNTPLGFITDEIYKQTKCNLESGDILFLYSDGFTEACDPSGDFFGENRLVSCIKQYSKLTPSILIKHIHHQISQFTQNKHLGDDLTCVVLKQNQDPSVCAQTAYINISDSTPPNLSGSIRIKSALSELQKVRQFVIDYCQSIDIARDSKIFIWQLETAIIELISNVIKYAYLCEDQHDIVIRANSDDKKVTIIVNHWGNPFPQPTCVPKPPEGEYPEGGYGLFIIDNFIDQCVYLKDDDAMNSIVVVKQKR